MGSQYHRQPDPVTTPQSADVLPLVLIDLVARGADGLRKYGTPLRSHNGRDALRDAYEEAMDLCLYLRQAIAERDGAA